MGTLVRTKSLFIAISLVKLNHSHRKKVLQEDIPEVPAMKIPMGGPLPGFSPFGSPPAKMFTT